MNYAQRSFRPRVLFLHGAGQDARAAQWLSVPGLVSVDLPGHGARRRARPGLRLVDMADEVAGWATEPMHVVGSGVGGMMALQLALDHPGLVRSLVVASAIGHSPSDAFIEDRAVRTEQLDAEGQRLLIHEAMIRWFTPHTLALQPRPAPVAYAESQATMTGKGPMADIWRSALGFDVRARLATLEPPVTCVGGTYDTQIVSSTIRGFADEIAGSRFVEVASAHMAAHLEVPDEFSAVVNEHLDLLSH